MCFEDLINVKNVTHLCLQSIFFFFCYIPNYIEWKIWQIKLLNLQYASNSFQLYFFHMLHTESTSVSMVQNPILCILQLEKNSLVVPNLSRCVINWVRSSEILVNLPCHCIVNTPHWQPKGMHSASLPWTFDGPPHL